MINLYDGFIYPDPEKHGYFTLLCFCVGDYKHRVFNNLELDCGYKVGEHLERKCDKEIFTVIDIIYDNGIWLALNAPGQEVKANINGLEDSYERINNPIKEMISTPRDSDCKFEVRYYDTAASRDGKILCSDVNIACKITMNLVTDSAFEHVCYWNGEKVVHV